MNTFDIILLNIISYMGGIFTGFYITHKISKKQEKKEKDVTDNIQIVPSAPVYPVTPPFNPELSSKPVTKLVLSTE